MTSLKPIQVLHVSETAIGGVATYLRALSGLVADDLQQSYLLPENHVDGLTELSKVETYPAKKRGLSNLVQFGRALVRRCRTSPPQIVFFHSTFALFGLVLLRITNRKIRTVYCSHGWAISRYRVDSLKGRIVRIIEGKLCGLADVVVNVSTGDEALARQLGYSGHHITIENAVEEPAESARDDLFADEPEAIHLLFVGRFDRQKGLDILLAAFADAHKVRPDLRLHIVGATVRDDGAPIELPEGASLSGWVERNAIDDWYRSADALVVPSRWEGFGLVVPESLRNGTPAVVSNIGALPTLIAHGETGYIFELDQTELSKTLTALDRESLAEMKQACEQAYLERFNISRFWDEISSLFRGLLR
ncbi:glycosyltransferase family 4 protein [Actibacterium atlanticum]|uniref:glycosyltransferase family 4 protein n=1 Tax=Actibacterium atlanticum TaxID=1461693 RepID=UPI0009DD1CFD|nr:glycosyltransferase family 4 protein [Actibacterium atlanticum]